MKEDWNILSLGDCFEFIRNGANIKQEKGAGGIPITRIETLAGGVFNRDRLGYADIKSTEKYASYILESGDLLFSHINSKAYIGRTILYEKEGSEIIIHGMNLLRMKVIPTVVIPKFIFYSFKSQYFREQVASYRKDAVNQSSISVGDLKKIQIAVPSIPSQQRIVAELDLLSGIVEKKNAQLRTLDELASTIFYEMFGDPVSNEKHWPVKQLSSISTLLNGRAYKQDELLDKGKYKVLRVGNFFTNDNYYYSDLELEPEKYCDNGDLLFAWSASFGAFIWSGPKVIYHYHIWKVLFDEKELNKLYYQYLLNAMTSSFMKDVHGIGMVHLTKGGMEQYLLPIPPREMQEQFAKMIEALERCKRMLSYSLAAAQELLASRMDKHFNV